MTTAERMYAAFSRVTTPTGTPITPFCDLDGPRMATWEIRAAAFESRALRMLPLPRRLYAAMWTNLYVAEWRAVDEATRTTWRLIADAWLALEREDEAA